MNYAPRIIKINHILSKEFYDNTPPNIIYYNNIFEQSGGHYISNYSIKYITRGIVNYQLDGREFMLRKNDLLIVNDGTEVTYHTEASLNANSAFSICIDRAIMNDTFASLSKRNNLSPNNGDSQIHFFEDLSYKEITLAPARKLRALFYGLQTGRIEVNEDFFYHLSELMVSSHMGVQFSLESFEKVKKTTKLEIYKRVYKAVEYISDNFKTKFDLERVAEESCMSKFYLIKFFRYIVGSTPNEFHIQKRIKYAKGLLKEKKISIAEISSACGYPDVYSFSKQFRKTMGVAPTTFRQHEVYWLF